MTDPLFSMQGKVALVTGAASGFGAHFARLLAQRGARVACAARRRERIEEVANDIVNHGGEALAVSMDVTDRASVTAAFDAVEARFGPVDVVINNAGQAAPGPFHEMTEQDWDNVLDVNLKGTWRVAQVAAQRLIAAGRPGSVINIASILGLVARPGFSNYSTSKAAILHMTRNLALDLMPFNIRVNAIAPGFFRTEMTDWWFQTEQGKREVAALPPGCLGEIADLDGPLLLLASDASRYMSGSVITVDAAHSVRIS